LSYSTDWWQTSITYFGSIFNNENDSLNWDNPYSSSTGVDSGQMALAPDNSSHQVSLAGSMLLPARTTLNGQLSFGRLKQDEDFLSYTTNTSIATSPLPVTSADAEVDTLNVNLRAVTSPWDKTTLEAELRYNDFDNKTAINNYNYVNTDSTIAPSPVSNSAYDYTRRDIKFRGEYRMNYNVKFHAGFDTQRFERNSQDRSHTTTNKLWFRTRSRIGSDTKVDIDLFTEKRDGSSYNTVENPATPENPLMRKYNMTNRDREGIKLQGTTYGGGTTDFGWEIEHSRDSYSDSLGLSDSKYLRYGLNFTKLLNNYASAYASLYNERIDTDQNNSQSFSAQDWSATTDDTFTTATVGIIYPKIMGSIDASLDYTFSRSVGETDNDTSGLPSSFPDLRTKRHNIKLGLSYPYSKSLSFGFDYLYEKFESDDYALDGVEPDTVSNLLSLGADSYNYDVSVFYLSMRYQLSPK
jgi:MtrB/PioB family decaheme-associated outer membrane protein